MNRIYISLLILIIALRQIIMVYASDDTYINTTNVIYDEDNNIIELAENSKININETNILVDRGIIDYDKDIIEVYGDFYLYQDLNILSGKDLVGNTSLTKFSANEVSYIYNNDLKVDSSKSERSKNIAFFYDNFLTPCDLDGFFNCPTWSLRIDKTKYELKEDKFTHYDTFFQIADKKLFYLPYFSHYGVKAPRKKGFLTPTIEFTIGGDTGIFTPYYIPLTQSTDILFKPKLVLDTNFQLVEKFSMNTLLKTKTSGGNVSLDVYNERKENSDIYSSAKFNAKQTLNKNNVLSAEALITNSISTTRSINEDPVSFEDIFIRLDSYNIFNRNDYLKSEISTVAALDVTDLSLIPLSPSLRYKNVVLSSKETFLINEFNLGIIKRNDSSIDKPSDNYHININNYLSKNHKKNNLNIYNKLSFINNFNSYKFVDNSSLDDDIYKSDIILSSDIFYNNINNIRPRIKFIHSMNLISDKIINEDSGALSFNYQNQFSDSRYYGKDKLDNSSRIVYGSESKFNPFGHSLNLKINQSYDFNKNTNYTNDINQKSNFSDFALEANTEFNNFYFQVDTRLNKENLSKKELNYTLSYNENFNFNLTYNETSNDSFKSSTTDTKSLGLGIGRQLNDNINVSYSSNIDLKNSYSPISQSLNLNLSDECSKLVISYKNDRYNDSYNVQPNETISISYYMDYLGFFGYEQKTKLLFEEPGNFNYGL